MGTEAFRLSRLSAGLQPLVAEAIALAKEAGRILRRRFRTAIAVTVKGPADLVTAADIEVQGSIVRRLRSAFPGRGVLAEEGLDATAGTEWRWIVDPLDGTKNFAHGFSLNGAHADYLVTLARTVRGLPAASRRRRRAAIGSSPRPPIPDPCIRRRRDG